MHLARSRLRDRLNAFECNGCMKKNRKIAAHSIPELIEGELWQFGTRCIQIRHVGRRLVEHRGMSLVKKRCEGRSSLSAIGDLQKWIVDNHAVRVTI
jgi:hypothetical protein